MPNRLAGETSPYLLQHQHNPVDWYPWGAEAFARARREDKPIFLSVGYSTCYWCHVMERQSFENAAVAAVMNELFVNIKVDREERPDVDQLYMTAVQVQTHHGGWPMSAFLTPDLQYFYGGTYFPPDDRYGRPGFVTLLRAIDEAWRSRRAEVLQSAAQFAQVLKQLAEPPPPSRAIEFDSAAVASMIGGSTDDYDPLNGGFGSAPKFPRETLLELLLRSLTAPSRDSQRAARDSQLTRKLRHALDAMAHGGIRDQVGGGFHRYSTDARWLVPHFEIMLYDNAMLGQTYAEAARLLDAPRFAKVAREVFDFVLRSMTSPDGAFYTAYDAEVDAKEGEPYLWTREQVRRALTDEPNKGTGSRFSDADADLFCRVYGLDEGPNFADPHGEDPSPHANVLYVADRKGLEENDPLIDRMRSHLLGERSKRKQPGLDTKVITSWNALMIRALAVGGAALREEKYVNAAASAADWLLRNHRIDGSIKRTSRDGTAKVDGFLDDFAFLADALLDLHDVTAEQRWRDAAAEIAGEMMRRFHDDADGGFYFSDASAQDLIVRQKIITDSPLPAGYAVAVDVMRRLGETAVARRAVEVAAASLASHADSASRLVQATIELISDGPIQVAPAQHSSARPLQRPQSPQDLAESIVELDADLEDGTLRLRVRIAPGYHLQAHVPGKGMIATRVILPARWTEAGATVEYPEGEAFTAPFAEAPVLVYSGEIDISIRLPPDVDLEGAALGLEYQACDESACLPPLVKRFTLH